MLFQFTAVSALVPSLLLLWFFRSRDLNPEPARVLWATFGLGVLITLPILGVELVSNLGMSFIADPFLRGFCEAFGTAAVPEEGFKFLVLFLYCARHKEFDEPMDGVVYGATASLGFATLENVLYVAHGGAGAALMRAFSAVPFHAFDGAIMGYFVGRARFDPARSTALLVRGLLAAVALHGLYDFPLLSLNHLAHGGQLAKADQPAAGALVLLTVAVLAFEVVWAVRLTRRLRAEQLQVQWQQRAQWQQAQWQQQARAAAFAGAAQGGPLGQGAPAMDPATDPRATPAARGGNAGGWALLVGGGLLASGGGLLTLAIVAGFAMDPDRFGPRLGELALGTAVVGVLPLALGLALFALGIRRLQRAGSAPATTPAPAPAAYYPR